MNSPISLDDLWREARIAGSKQKAAKAKAKAEAPPADPRSLYTNPDNWIRTRGVGLIHADTETLLGSFDEWTHRSVENCRRLVRATAPIQIDAVERVSGSWWIADERKPEPRQEWHTKRPAILHLHLDTLSVHAPAVEVTVCLSYGGIARVELAHETRFAQDHKSAEQLLFFPAGTDVLPVMSLESKIALQVELGASK